MSDNQVTEPSETATRLRFISAASGLQYTNPKAAGDILSVIVGDKVFVEHSRAAEAETERDQLRAELAKAQEERDALLEEEDARLASDPAEVLLRDSQARELRLIEQVAALTAALDKAREDKEIVDWFEANAVKELKIDSDGIGVQLYRWHRKYVTYHSWSGSTFRAACRAALAQP